MNTLGDRQKDYEQYYDQRILRRLPLIIRVNGNGFSRVTKKLARPFCPIMLRLMSNTMLETAKSIQGCVFAYHQSDQITFVIRNDQSLDTEPWFSNKIQKVTSIT